MITPPVDDPGLFGEVAAANALSDVYAMGGRPVTALNLVFFPSGKLGPEVLAGIVAGAGRKIAQAGAALAGGHSVDDEEPKFGLAVTGVVHPDRIWRNRGVRPGDHLVLTKPLGSGVLFNAHRKRILPAASLDACLDVVTRLNARAAEVLSGFEVHAATDVTGFGLLGHALGMARASEVTLDFRFDDLPFLRDAVEMYRRGVTTKANAGNHELVGGSLAVRRRLAPHESEMLIDPQTSGGLLAAVPAAESGAVVEALRAAGLADARVVAVAGPLGERLLVVS